MLNLTGPQYRRLAQVIRFVLLALIVFTFRDYGITWDEELQSQYGLAVVDYYRSLFTDLRFQEIFNLYLYGGAFDGVTSLIDQFTPFTLYETRHLINALVGLLGLWGTWRLGRLLAGPAVGIMALVMLAITPMYYGHMFNNPKDIPFATGIIWSLYFMGRCFVFAPVIPRRLLIKLGLALGLTLGVRIGGIMLWGFWGVVLGTGLLLMPKTDGIQGKVRYGWLLLARFVIPATLIAYVVMLICWPWAQQNPILNPLRALSEFSNFPQDVEVQLDGVTYMSTQLPWYYVPLYFGVQLPEFLLVLIAASIVTLPLLWKSLNFPRRQLLCLMVMMAGFPILYAMLRHPALYDAVRHFLFVVPIACVIAAMTARYSVLWAIAEFERPSSRKIIGAGFAAIAVLVIVTQVTIMVRLHPYEYIYVNRFAGGVTGASGRYELDYWGSSFKDAAEKLLRFVRKHGGVPEGKIYKVAICGPWSAAMIYMPPDYEPVVANEPAEFFIATTRWECQNMRPGRVIARIDRMGAPLAVVKDLRNGYEHYEGNEKK
jgi:hypothetical protein